MERIEQKHVDFLKLCADTPNRIHKVPEGMDPADASALSVEGLLIQYNKPGGAQYAITGDGSRFIQSFGATDTPEMVKLAVAYVMTKGYDEEAAQTIVKDNGCAIILKSQVEEESGNRQREVKLPTDANGNTRMQFRG